MASVKKIVSTSDLNPEAPSFIYNNNPSNSKDPPCGPNATTSVQNKFYSHKQNIQNIKTIKSYEINNNTIENSVITPSNKDKQQIRKGRDHNSCHKKNGENGSYGWKNNYSLHGTQGATNIKIEVLCDINSLNSDNNHLQNSRIQNDVCSNINNTGKIIKNYKRIEDDSTKMYDRYSNHSSNRASVVCRKSRREKGIRRDLVEEAGREVFGSSNEEAVYNNKKCIQEERENIKNSTTYKKYDASVLERGGRRRGGRGIGERGNKMGVKKHAVGCSDKVEKALQGATISSADGQRERLEDELRGGGYECMVCCSEVGVREAVWSCGQCHHVFHLHCILKWAASPNSHQTISTAEAAMDNGWAGDAARNNSWAGDAASGGDAPGHRISSGDARPTTSRGQGGEEEESKGIGWRCPTCQLVSQHLPRHYFCFCGKRRNPPFSAYIAPHSCGEVCGRQKCKHPCSLLCHPGPCPPCSAFTVVKCLCAKTSTSVKCSLASDVTCTHTCSRTQNCGSHHCSLSCHSPPCPPCQQLVEQKCRCGKEERVVLCGSQLYFQRVYNCKEVCGKRLSCDQHTCSSPCHPPPCSPCPLLPSSTTHCPCGRVSLGKLGGEVRERCVDPIKCCGGVCGKELLCGEKGNRHRCSSKCHEGVCSHCDQVMVVQCRCGSIVREVECEEVMRGGRRKNAGGGEEGEVGEGAMVVCDTKCARRMSCGRHKCQRKCCEDHTSISTTPLHQCKLLCGYKLSCGLHRCQEACHKSRCTQCWNVSFEELRCECGAEVIYPPVQCGTEPPPCARPCSRQHACSHQVLHPCHHAPSCPPCTILVQRSCLCGKEVRRNVPCYLKEVSCGLPCSNTLPCRVHHCLKLCHQSSCSTEAPCTQACPLPRASCGHPCNHPCHPHKPCPAGVCHQEITGACACGRKKQGKMLCLQEEKAERTADYSAYEALQASLGESVEQGSSKETLVNKSSSLNSSRISCDEECQRVKRNRLLAEALGVDQKQQQAPPIYSDFVVDYARKNVKFSREVETALSDLVTSALQVESQSSCNSSRKYHYFKQMSQTHRRYIHEVVASFGCTSESHDEGVHRSVVVCASKFYAKLPSSSIEKSLKKSPL